MGASESAPKGELSDLRVRSHSADAPTPDPRADGPHFPMMHTLQQNGIAAALQIFDTDTSFGRFPIARVDSSPRDVAPRRHRSFGVLTILFVLIEVQTSTRRDSSECTFNVRPTNSLELL
jgi:hypothetical protein